MKGLLSIFLLLIGSGAMAQPYIPLLGQTNEWRAISCNNGCITDAYYTSGDTVIDNNSYHILDGYHYIQGNFLLREDVAARKVYMKLLAEHTLLDEYPLYDFSIEDGDTVDVYNPISPLPENGGKFVLDSVVFRPLENDNHRFFYLHAVNPSISLVERTVWVEGVGSLSLINTPAALPTESNHLGCAFKDGVLQYADTDSIWSCGALNVEDPEQRKRLSVFPNPSNGIVTASYNGTETPVLIRVLSYDGKLVASFPWQLQLNLSHLHNGLYLLQFQWADARIEHHRLLLTQ